MSNVIAKALILLPPLLAWLYRARGSFQLRPRSNLRADCELLTMLKSVDANSSSMVEKRIDEQVARLYTKRGSRLHHFWAGLTTWRRVILGSVILVAGLGLTAYLVRDGFTWWSLLTGYVVVAGLGILLNGLDARHARELGRAFGDLGEKAFELFENKSLDPGVDGELGQLVENITDLKQQVAESAQTGTRAGRLAVHTR